ncbi:hypothetical protein BLNAU_21928 [Blattamonas nauphoetae]|uniref:Uncharacterized protein n=1 Tax=Blattamonas nauphoetae TaxID=2049346 RepID=A0ABQ9WUK4_9EUKA|nr:hypothetical protein BLNAU_21928 [Blattamonas nauphoetae]
MAIFNSTVFEVRRKVEMDEIVNTEIQKNLLIKWMTLAINSFVHLAKTKVLETIEGGRKMIERNTTVLTIIDTVLFTSSSDRNDSANGDVLVCQSPSSSDLATLFINMWKQSNQAARRGARPNHQRSPERSPVVLPCLPDNHHHTRESEPTAAIVKKIITHSLSIFNQSAQDYNRSPTTPHEVGSKADKADTLFEMIMVQSGVEVRIYPHSKGSIPPPLVHVVTGQAGKFSTMLTLCGILAHSSEFLKQLLHLSETIFTVSDLLIVFSQSSHTTNMMLKAVSSVNGLVRRQPHPVVRRRGRLPRATLRILEPVFTTLPNMWTKLTQSDFGVGIHPRNFSRVLRGVRSILHPICEAVLQIRGDPHD